MSEEIRTTAALIHRQVDMVSLAHELNAVGAGLNPYKDLSAIGGLDVHRAVGDLARQVDVSAELRTLAVGTDFSTEIRQALSTLDIAAQYRDLTDRLTRSLGVDWTRIAVGLVDPPLTDALAEVAGSLEDGSATDEGETVSRWLADLPPQPQRRLLLMVINVLALLLNTADAFANVNPPAHLERVIALLLGIAFVLNELVGDSPSQK